MSAKLPLDDPRWLPLADAHARLGRRTGSPGLAARDLSDAMKSGDVRSLRRPIGRGSGPDRELLAKSFWTAHELYSGSALLVVDRSRGGQIITAAAARGFAFFVWSPDLERYWPGICPEPAPKRVDTPKPGSAAAWIDELYPNREWRLMTGKQVHDDIARTAKESGQKRWPSYSAAVLELRKRRQQQKTQK